MKMPSTLSRLFFLVLALLAGSAHAQLNETSIITIPTSPFSFIDYLTIIVPAHGCYSPITYSQNLNQAALVAKPVVSVTHPTPVSAGTIDISVSEVDILCGPIVSEGVRYAVPISVGHLHVGAYTINYPTHSLSLDIIVTDAVHVVTPLPGLWAITSEVNGAPGRGFQVELHGNTMVLTFYGYDASGKGRFWLASGPYGYNTFSATLTTYDGGTTFGGAAQSAHDAGTAGTLTVTFTSPTTGTITLPNESPKAISYFQF